MNNTNNPTLSPITTGQIAASPFPYAAVYRDDDEPIAFVVVDITRTTVDGSWVTVSQEFEEWSDCAAVCAKMNLAWIAATSTAAA